MKEKELSKLKEWLVRKGESGLKFSERTKIPQQTIYRIIHGGRPQKRIAKRISRYTNYEVTLEDLGHSSMS